MKLEVMLSVMNLNKEDLDKMNITSKCTVINQCGKENFEKYKNFNIYSYNEIGTSNSRNRGLEHITEDIILLCDDDIIYNEDYEKNILQEFKNNKKADVIIFNVNRKHIKKRMIKNRKRLRIYNCLHYASVNIAFRKNVVLEKKIKFNNLFGPNAKYSNGEDTLLIVDMLKNKLKIYSSPINIGISNGNKSTWFNGYNEKFFFDKGALFTVINKRLRLFLIIQYLIRHNDILSNINFLKALKIMLRGSKDYINNYYA